MHTYLFTLHYYLLLAKNPAVLVKSEELRIKNEKVKIPHFRAGFLAGAGGFHTPLRSVASLSCGQRPHFAEQKRQTLPRPPLCGWRVLTTVPQRNKRTPSRWLGVLLFGRGRRIRTRDPRFWSSSKTRKSLINPRFFARFNVFS